MLRMGGSLTARRGFVGSLMAVVLVAGCFVLGASRLYWPVHAGDDGAVGATSAQSEAVSMGFMADAGHPVQTPEPSLLSRAATVRSSSLAAADVPAPPARLDEAALGQTQVLQVGQQLVVTLGPGWSRPRAQMPADDVGSAIQPLRTDTGPPGSTAPSTVFTAVRVGEAVVVAQGSAGSQYAVSVVVQPVPGQPAGPLPKRPSP